MEAVELVVLLLDCLLMLEFDFLSYHLFDLRFPQLLVQLSKVSHNNKMIIKQKTISNAASFLGVKDKDHLNLDSPRTLKAMQSLGFLKSDFVKVPLLTLERTERLYDLGQRFSGRDQFEIRAPSEDAES